MISDADREAMLRELIQLSGVLPQADPDEFTQRDFAEQAGCSITAAEAALKRLADAGHITRRAAIYNGRRATVYRRVTK